MRKLLAILLALSPLSAFPQSPLPPSPSAMSADLRTVGSFYPRLEGSTGEKKTVSFIKGRLESQGIPYTSFDFSASEFQHSFSTCIRVDVAGALRDTVIVAVPLDHPQDAGPLEDGSVNIVLALSLLQGLRDNRPPLSVTVLFLGAEFGDTREYPMGSALFLQDFRPDFRAAVLYLNMRAVPDRLVVRGGGTGIVSPYWLIERSVEALRKAHVSSLLRDYENQVFRMGLAGGRSIIDPFLTARYPAVSLEADAVGHPQTVAEEWLFSFYLFFTEFLHASPGGIPEDWDRHFLQFPVGSGSLLIPEKSYVIMLAAALAGALLYSLSFRRGLKKYIRTLVRNFPSILPIYVLPFLLLLTGTLAVEAILTVRRFASLWSYAPLPFLALRMCVPFLLFAALYPLLRRLPFSRNGSFYSAAALFFLIADTLVVAAVNVSFTPYFLWAMAFVLLASLVPNRWAKLVLYLPSAFLGLLGLMEVFLMPAIPFCGFILLSRVRGNLLVAGFSLPFILYWVRLGLLFRGRGLLSRTGRTVLAVALLGAATAALAVGLLRYSPFGPDNPRPLLVQQYGDITGHKADNPFVILNLTLGRDFPNKRGFALFEFQNLLNRRPFYTVEPNRDLEFSNQRRFLFRLGLYF